MSRSAERETLFSGVDADDPATWPTFPDLTPEQARALPSESGHGWTLDGMSPFFPAIPCCDCGRFVGRDGAINVEHFEMSHEIASVDGTCRRCLGA